ncbi:hypothetical protein CSKR_203408 [Clonorchis sinensis]|uniref:Uncharacterized protein n=1 Tax=Clonorchis sinensis TaxID=79923 RepID=A0A8T1M9U0_CLOSI|nr:hypothetical protein CSKR_203408 [Clonorchis sinensis]
MGIPKFVAMELLFLKFPRGCQPASHNLLDKGRRDQHFKAAILGFSSKSTSAIASTVLPNENNGNKPEYDQVAWKVEGAVTTGESAGKDNGGDVELDKSVGTEEAIKDADNEEILVRDSREKGNSTLSKKQLESQDRRDVGSNWKEVLNFSPQGGGGSSGKGRGCPNSGGRDSSLGHHSEMK